MKAVRIKAYGGPETLQLEEIAVPIPGPEELLVRVQACGVNRLDVLLRNGKVFRVPLPHIPGTDIAGEIAGLGANTQGWQLGDRVLVAPILSCGQCDRCLAGRDNLCQRFGTVGSSIPGGYAEYVVIPARNAITIPTGMSFEAAASLPLNYATATNMLRKAALAPGESVLIMGASGGLGSAALQVAKAMGARVIAVVRQEHHQEKVLALGADEVLMANGDLSHEVRDLTQNQGVDVAFEHVGAATFAASLASLRTDGRMVTAGATTGELAQLDLQAIYLKRLSILGCRGSGRLDLEFALKLWHQGRLKPPIDKVLPLGDAAKAHSILEQGDRFGRIILQV